MVSEICAYRPRILRYLVAELPLREDLGMPSSVIQVFSPRLSPCGVSLSLTRKAAGLGRVPTRLLPRALAWAVASLVGDAWRAAPARLVPAVAGGPENAPRIVAS